MTSCEGRAIWPAPHPEGGTWEVALDPDGITATVGIKIDGALGPSLSGEIEGGWAKNDIPSIAEGLRALAYELNARLQKQETLHSWLNFIPVHLVSTFRR